MPMRKPMKFPLLIPFVETLGFQLWRFDSGQAEIAVDLAEAHLNSWDVAHGGVMMTLLDVAMAHAARSVQAELPDGGPGVATVEMKTSFMRPAEGRLVAQATLLHRTRTLAFCEGSVRDDSGALCAHATATFKFVRSLAGRDHRPAESGDTASKASP
jgi:uncharacterized protein (TIGR00369 family)